LGVLVADLIGGPVESLPDSGGIVLVDDMGLHSGGGAVNTSSALAKLGLDVEIIGMVGSDPLGDFLIDSLKRRGIRTQGVSRNPALNTSATMVIVDPDGERRFIHYFGANAGLTKSDVNLDMIKSASILHVASAFVIPGLDGQPLAEILGEARADGTIVCLDTSWDESRPWQEVLEPVLPYVDYFLPSLVEAQAITGYDDPRQAAAALLNFGVGTVVVKLGHEGCLVSTSDDRTFHLPSHDVEAVDSTGAGDVFNAGFIAGIYMGQSIRESASMANAMGALCVTAYGAAGGLRSLSEIKDFMNRAPLRGPVTELVQQHI
jgi:sugar/nucleoside kinase (ribokinase family)